MNLADHPTPATEEFSVVMAQLFKELNESQQQALIRVMTSASNEYHGPLPDAETIRVYNQVIPNGGERLMITFEKQVEHRLHIEQTGQRRSLNQSAIGQWMGFLISVLFGVISWDLVKSGHDSAGMVIGGADLVALVTIFVANKAAKSS
ncbi:MAG: DUF2335 domain-containing protein [Chitinophagales bacterium]